jgi:dTMP kinase
MFITFEGPEGSGKSSQVIRLAEALQQQGWSVVTTREPGGTPIGDEIRACVHHVGHSAMAPEAEFLLYSASRAQLVQEVIRPSLAAGQVVLCDRFADSTLAYQGYGRQLDLAALQTITHFATGGLQPHLTLLLDLAVEHGLARRQQGGLEMNRLDLEKLDFHQRVRQGYLQLAQTEPARWVILDADRTPEAVFADVLQVVLSRLA